MTNNRNSKIWTVIKSWGNKLSRCVVVSSAAADRKTYAAKYEADNRSGGTNDRYCNRNSVACGVMETYNLLAFRFLVLLFH